FWAVSRSWDSESSSGGGMGTKPLKPNGPSTPIRCEGENPHGGMAQLVAHLLCKQRVRGSSPLTSTRVVLRQHSQTQAPDRSRSGAYVVVGNAAYRDAGDAPACPPADQSRHRRGDPR